MQVTFIKGEQTKYGFLLFAFLYNLQPALDIYVLACKYLHNDISNIANIAKIKKSQNTPPFPNTPQNRPLLAQYFE